MAYAFISYMRQDQDLVDRLYRSLREAEVHVWLDRDSIAPGEYWNTSLRTAITRGSFFIACFSDAYYKRPETYMREEVALAASVLSAGRDSSWFLPIRLTNVEIPDLPIGRHGTLRNIQWLDLFDDWDDGIRRLIAAIRPLWWQDLENAVRRKIIAHGCKLHINNKIKHFHEYNAHRFREIEDRWKDAVEGEYSPDFYNAVLKACNAAAANNQPATERLIERCETGRMVLVTAAPYFDNSALIQWLTTQSGCEAQTYSSFVVHQKRRLRELPHWEKRDLLHWIFMQEGSASEMQCDLLYVCSYDLMLNVSAYRRWLMDTGKADFLMPVEQIYPTTLMTATDCEVVIRQVLMEDAQKGAVA